MSRLVVLPLLVACTDDGHDYVRESATSGLAPVFSVVARGDGTTTVTARMYIYNTLDGGYLKFSEGDSLVVRHAGTTLPLMKMDAMFPTNEEGAEFEVSFMRTVDAGAPSSRARLPAKFELSAVPFTVSRRTAITLTWEPSLPDQYISWYAEGDCVTSAGDSYTLDRGILTLPALKRREGVDEDACVVTVSVSRTVRGELDAAFEGYGGGIWGLQERVASFVSIP